MGFSIVIIFIIVIFLVVAIVASNFQEKIKENMAVLGQRLNLEYKFNKPSTFSAFLRYTHPELVGVISERYPIRIYIKVKGSGKNQVYYMAFDLDSRTNKPYRFTLMHEGFFRKIGKALGMQKDIEIRDDEFDSQFIIKSDNALFAKQLLVDPELRDVFLNQYNLLNNGEFKIENGKLFYEGIKSIYNSREIDNMEGLVKMALVLVKRLEEMESESFTDFKEFN
jgi:hypothetical protein